jgi:hypothetical protein
MTASKREERVRFCIGNIRKNYIKNRKKVKDFAEIA